MIIVLNMFIFVVLCNLNTKKTFDDRINYNHVFIMEERAKRIIKKRFIENSIENLETETIYYDNDFIHFDYVYNSQTKIWTVYIHIKYDTIHEYAYIYYSEITNELEFKTR